VDAVTVGPSACPLCRRPLEQVIAEAIHPHKSPRDACKSRTNKQTNNKLAKRHHQKMILMRMMISLVHRLSEQHCVLSAIPDLFAHSMHLDIQLSTDFPFSFMIICKLIFT
jgi:hypothetical protein